MNDIQDHQRIAKNAATNVGGYAGQTLGEQTQVDASAYLRLQIWQEIIRDSRNSLSPEKAADVALLIHTKLGFK